MASSVVLKNPSIDTQIVSVALVEVKTQKREKIAKFRNLSLKYDLMILKMTSAVENEIIELVILKNP